jgi:hypothetical protein
MEGQNLNPVELEQEIVECIYLLKDKFYIYNKIIFDNKIGMFRIGWEKYQNPYDCYLQYHQCFEGFLLEYDDFVPRLRELKQKNNTKFCLWGIQYSHEGTKYQTDYDEETESFSYISFSKATFQLGLVIGEIINKPSNPVFHFKGLGIVYELKSNESSIKDSILLKKITELRRSKQQRLDDLLTYFNKPELVRNCPECDEQLLKNYSLKFHLPLYFCRKCNYYDLDEEYYDLDEKKINHH